MNMDRSFIFSGVHYYVLRYDKTVMEGLLYSGHTKQNSSPTVGQKEGKYYDNDNGIQQKNP